LVPYGSASFILLNVLRDFLLYSKLISKTSFLFLRGIHVAKVTCENCNNQVEEKNAKWSFHIQDTDGKHSKKYIFCSQECRDKFAENHDFKLEP
jgi:YHS domain-containing protein